MKDKKSNIINTEIPKYVLNQLNNPLKENNNIVLATYTDSVTAIKRDYNANLSLEKRTFLSEENINEYNQSLINMKKLANQEKINFHMFNTASKNQREISFKVINVILDGMRPKMIDELNQEF